ncbi:hypothetical protein Btru_057391 [Bulinus truncatus]|nr:hypothetical protein Btru_057391 [Bulinus truncatus]
MSEQKQRVDGLTRKMANTMQNLNIYGKHEIQVSEGGEADLQKHVADCKKNPDHLNFIPVAELSMHHLPDGHRNIDLYHLINVAADLTVRVDVRSVSSHRPEFYPNTNYPYPFSSGTDRNTSRYGSGRVMNVVRFTNGHGRNVHGKRHTLFEHKFESEYKSCPCDACERSGKPRNVWWEIYVCTASHVVYDETEACQTSCRLFYDAHDCQFVDMKNMAIGRLDTGSDFCELKYITCEASVGERLYERALQCHQLWRRVRDEHKGASDDRLSFIVSHPHGCPKQVSFGECVGNHHLGDVDRMTEFTQMTYRTPTCPGSSGAWVFCVSFDNYHVHSGTLSCGLNYSSVGRCRY